MIIDPLLYMFRVNLITAIGISGVFYRCPIANSACLHFSQVLGLRDSCVAPECIVPPMEV